MEHVVSFVCWIETSRQVVSFHEFDQSQQQAFPTKTEMMNFVLSIVDQGYRIQ